ncbi:MAG: hypothetical protein CL912_09990 [Deltaproteobacteria bacterium]|nr:hypothetical protein [Deltaproteobacteria bacterium]
MALKTVQFRLRELDRPPEATPLRPVPGGGSLLFDAKGRGPGGEGRGISAASGAEFLATRLRRQLFLLDDDDGQMQLFVLW